MIFNHEIDLSRLSSSFIYVYIPFLVLTKIESIFELLHRNICYDILEKQLNWVLWEIGSLNFQPMPASSVYFIYRERGLERFKNMSKFLESMSGFR